jgi:hypothetical protein
MAVTRWLELRCDICEGDAFGGLRPGITAAELRAEARRRDWKRAKDGRDICDHCAALPVEKKETEK